MQAFCRRTFVSLLAVAPFAVAAAQFPAFQAETLTGEKITVPSPETGGPVLLIIGFTHGSNEQTTYWAKKIPKDLVPTYSLATLGGAPKLMRRMILHSMKSNVSKDQQGHFLITYDNDEKMKQALGFQEPNDAYLALLAANGVIRWTFHGPFSHTKLKELSDQVRGMRQ